MLSIWTVLTFLSSVKCLTKNLQECSNARGSLLDKICQDSIVRYVIHYYPIQRVQVTLTIYILKTAKF